MNAVVAAAAPLVGRDAELRVLRAVLPRVLENQAQVLALSGQAGVGKSRLAQECLAVARDRGFLPLAGAGGALQQDLAYAPLVEALRPLVRAAAEPGRSALVEGLPDLGRLFGDLSLPPSPELRDPGLERTRMFESVCRLLERASARQPVVLLLDDAHWADRGSLALLHYLVRGLAGRPILAILTYRDDEADAALGELLAGLRRAGALTELPLTGLSDEAVGLLAHNLLDGAVPAGLLDVLTSRSGGLPLFVDALVGSFVESGALYRYEGLWALAPQHAEAVPAAVSALVESRVRRLPGDARQVLDLLAVCGARADHALLEQLMPGAGLLDGLSALRADGVVVEEVIDGRIRYRVTHALLCEVAYDLLPLVVRRRRHADVARAVQDSAPEQRGLLATHVRRAGDEVDAGYAFDVLVAAADDALARRAGDEVLADVRAALDLAATLGRPGAVAGLHDRLAQGYGLVGDQERAVSAWLAAAAARDDGVGRAERLQRAAQLEVEVGRYREGRCHVSEAEERLARVPPGPVHVSLALTRMHIALRSEDSAEIGAVTADLEQLRQRVESPQAWFGVHTGRLQVAGMAGRYAEGRVHLTALLQLVSELPDELGESARRPGFFVELGWGDLASASQLARDALDCARRTGVPTLERSPRTNLGIAAFFAGDWAETLRQARDVIDLGQRVGPPRATASGLALRGLVLLRRGQPVEAMQCAVRAREALERASAVDRHGLAPIELVEAWAALVMGEVATAAARAEDSVRRVSTLQVTALSALAEARIALGDLPAAAATAGALAALGPDAPYPGALAAWIHGRVDRDETLLRRAGDELAALGFVYEAAVARLDLAELTAARAAPWDSALEESLRALERLGAQPQVDRARRLMRRLGQRPPAPRRQPRAGGLSAREEQVARLVARGLSNPEIAAQLYLSIRTVTTHLQNSYARLGLTSRTALTRYVLEELPPDTYAGRGNT
jgi:DNA-binding CsgD family transcriptional regulator